jgi:hypothetical protein
MKAPILIWPFYDAPEEMKALSRHGGDEDWVLAMPLGEYDPDTILSVEWGIVDRIDILGDNEFNELEYDGKLWYVYITSHA